MTGLRRAQGQSRFKTRALIIWLGMLGVSFYNFQPFLIGGFVSVLQMSESQAGWVATSNMFGVCTSLAAVMLLGAAWRRNPVVLAALLFMAAGNLASGYVTTFEALLLVRFMTGLGEGLALAASVAAVARFSDSDRLFALIMVGMSAYGMVGLLVMPYAIESMGLTGVFVGIAVLSFLTLPAFGLLSESTQEERAGQPVPMSLATLQLLGSLTLLYVGMNGVWAYFERIGVSIGIDAPEIGVALSAGLFASMFGALLAVLVSDRIARPILLVVGTTLTGLSIGVLFLADGFTQYVTSVMLLFGASGFVVPYYMGQLADADRTGRLPVVGYLMVFVGSFVGPAVGAMLVRDGSYELIMLVGFALLTVAVILLVGALRTQSLSAENSAPSAQSELKG